MDFDAALKIAYPLRDPVVADLARYEAEYDRQQAYLEEITSRADALIDSGDLDSLVAAMPALEANRFHKAIAVICQCNTQVSREAATMEIRALLNKAARQVAEVEFKREIDKAAEDYAMDRCFWCTERCDA